MVNDFLSDALTRIRNAIERAHKEVQMPYSKVAEHVLQIMQKEGYLGEVTVANNDLDEKTLTVKILYTNGKPAITHMERVSRPSLRRYVGYKDIKRVLNGLGISILSTPKGIMTGQKAREEKTGGEQLCNIW